MVTLQSKVLRQYSPLTLVVCALVLASYPLLTRAAQTVWFIAAADYVAPVEHNLNKVEDFVFTYTPAPLQNLFKSGHHITTEDIDPLAVTPVFAERLPRQLLDTKHIESRKNMFIRTMLPHILAANKTLANKRAALEQILLVPEAQWSRLERNFIDELAAEFKVTDANWDELRRRVDVVPVAMALAQAAEESGWGTSRFAQKGNALFGQWTWDASQGMRPLQASAEAQHYVRRFDTLRDSVASYMHNINTSKAYEGLRRDRFKMRVTGAQLDSFELVGNLTKYSERGRDYVRSLRLIITRNNFDRFETARLAEPTRVAGLF